MKEKILILTPSIFPKPGGLERYTFNLALSLSKQNLEVHVMVLLDQVMPDNIENSLNYEKIIQVSELTNIWQKVNRKIQIRRLIKKKINELNPKIIICTWWEPLAYLLASIPAQKKSKTILITHGQELFSSTGNYLSLIFKKFILSRTIKSFTTLIGVSNFTKNRLLDLGASKEKTHFLPNGLTPEYIDKATNLINEKPSLLQALNGKIILQTGRIVQRKGHETMIRLLPEIQKRFNENIFYIIVGDGPYLDSLKKTTRHTNCADNVIFLGYLEENELHNWYNFSDLVVMLSHSSQNKGDVEGFGIVYLEAYAHNKPVIAADTGGVSDAVINNVTGLLVNPLNDEEIIQAVLKLLSDDNLRTKLGSRGKQMTNKEFNWDSIAQKMMHLTSN